MWRLWFRSIFMCFKMSAMSMLYAIYYVQKGANFNLLKCPWIIKNNYRYFISFRFRFFLIWFFSFSFLVSVVHTGYAFMVTWITAFVMVVVHERVPDMKRYPPLPDIFLDNVPHIPWAFHMCEITGTLLFLIWACVLIVHKHRFVLLRRFFALSGTVFLLRCVTMLITSLSVPGTHLQCRPDDYIVDDSRYVCEFAIRSNFSDDNFIWISGL